MFMCYIGSLLNGLLLMVFFSSINKIKVVESKEAKVILSSIFLIDFLQGLWVGTVNLVNYASNMFVGGHGLCSAHSFLIGTFSVFSCGIMDILALHLLIRVTHTSKILLPLKYLYLGLTLLWAALIPALIFVPGGAILDSSGIVCVAKYNGVVTYIFFSVVVVMIAFVVMVYVKIYLYYGKITEGTEHHKALQRKKKLMVRFSLMIFVSFGTLGPYASTLVYAWIAQVYPPPGYEIGAMFVWIFGLMLNPVLYIYNNPMVWKVLLFKMNLITNISSSESLDHHHSTTQTDITPSNHAIYYNFRKFSFRVREL
eukprot:TRINITY_DN18196_c0_g1_i1.p1 TRINITY_DN18196_c0_g1~~TRINITY_DN18196_c0_g1_i1.p1  ORF type:complete len:350 (+),score=78.31 TRINITY_DN18196_c0_g1_i1:115-1050(+)